MKKSMLLFMTVILIISSLLVPSLAEEVILKVDSNLFGSAFTTGKSTLKRERGITVSFDESSTAVMTLSLSSGEKIDDTLIDDSQATIALIDGDGYYAAEYVFSASSLKDEWKDGKSIYTIKTGEFDLDRDLYLQIDNNSGREWSCLGGDGQGNYKYDLVISGIKYDGKEIAAQTFPMKVRIYGYNYSADAVNLYGEGGTPSIEVEASPLENVTRDGSIQWIWAGEGEKPILCDTAADNFYAIWPEGMDFSSTEASVALTNGKGEWKTLEADKDYQVIHHNGQTQIALTYVNWAFQPVYTTLSISLGDEQGTFDIASVYVYEAQQGGGGTTIDGTVTAYSFYGLENLTSYEQLLSKPVYVLSKNQGENLVYYAEDEQGHGKLVDDMTLAKVFDATSETDRNPQLVGNTLYITTRKTVQNVTMTVDGESIELSKTYPGRKDAISGGGSLLSPTACDPNLKALSGYVIPWGTNNWITNEKWAWQNGVNEGWTGIEVTPYSGKFEHTVPAGQSQQFSANADVTWSIVGETAEGTSISEEGILTVSADEPTSAYFAVVATDANGEVGCVSIKVTKE